MIGQTPSTSSESTVATETGSYRHLFTPHVRYPLLLAIDNDDNAPAAIELTAALGDRGAEPTVLRSVPLMNPVPGNPAEATFGFTQAALGTDFLQEQENIIGYIIRETLDGESPWPIKSVVGEPASTIVAEAEEHHAELLVMGVHFHGKFAQALGKNTASRVMTQASMPVIGVRPHTTQLPRRIMVATDFGKSSWEGAHIAANLVNPGGTIVIAYVSWPIAMVDESDEGAALVKSEGIQRVYERLADELKTGKPIQVELVTREGDAATELLGIAEQVDPDMIASASQRHRLLTRMFLGSVCRQLVREGRWSMLVTPPVG
ncbi:MAG TPA: universal stress protein [Gemmatimonadaceae bacterium]|nr:universal stress protein [Gemmatimonadaceae bacterium]